VEGDEYVVSLATIAFNPADFDEDGDVDVSDLGMLATGYGILTGALKTDGDADNDGDVDVSDLGVLATEYGFGTAAVPEPSIFVALFGMALAGLAVRRRR
jgi:hypothetical protein